MAAPIWPSSSATAVAVFRGNGDGTFQSQVTYAVGSQPDAIVAGNFNGHTGLAVVNGDSTLSVLLGNGSGAFQPQVQVVDAVGSAPDAIASGDFNGDGRADVATIGVDPVTRGGEVSVLLGNGDGTFQPQVTYVVGADPVAIVSGDFNDDGRIDLAVADPSTDPDSSGTVSVLLGNGDGTFQPQVTYAAGISPRAIVTGDFNGDGRTDLAVVDYGSSAKGYSNGSVSVLLGNGDGTFQQQVGYAVGTAPTPIAAGDFNGDGRTDLAVAQGEFGQPGSVSVLLGNGDGTFQPQVIYPVGQGPGGIVIGDFNEDGRTDLAVANQNWSEGSGGTVSVLLGNGDGTFQPQIAYPVGSSSSYPMGITAGDFNGDGHTDLALADIFDNNVSVILGNGDGTFQPQVTYAVGNWPDAIAAGDFNGDGRTDLATANQTDSTVSVLLGRGDGTFTAPGQVVTTPHATPLVVDVNGDGTADLMVIDSAGNILYRQGVPGHPGTFEPPVTVNPGAPSLDIAWVPSTGALPVLASVDARDNAVSLYAWRGGRFVLLGSLATGLLPAQIIAADLNGDARTDLVVRNAVDGTLSVFLPVSISSSLSPAILAGRDHPRGPGCLRRPGGRYDRQRPARSRGHQQAHRTARASCRNLGGGAFGPPVPYRAGTGVSAIDTSGTPEVTSLDTTAGVAGCAADAWRAHRPGGDQPRLEHAGGAGRPRGRTIR